MRKTAKKKKTIIVIGPLYFFQTRDTKVCWGKNFKNLEGALNKKKVGKSFYRGSPRFPPPQYSSLFVIKLPSIQIIVFRLLYDK